jgi:ribosomal protein S18 acetylase RimI-like enzyme
MDAHIQLYLRAAASRTRDTEQIGPFWATFSRSSDNPFLNYAIPDGGATPSPADVAALIDAYRRRGRRPRLEYLPGLAPAVEAALVAAGFSVEGRLPLMICPPGAERDLPIPDGIELIAPGSDAELRAMIAAQHEAYGDPAPTSGEVERRKAHLAAGGIAVLAREVATGEAAGAGICDVPIDHTSELAGVGVRARFRRRGIAGALTAWLARRAFAAGVTTLFLMAAREEEARIYARVGFSTTSEILHISLLETS